MVWTDERMDDLVERVDSGFRRTDAAIAALDAKIDTKVDGLRVELDSKIESKFQHLDSRLDTLQTTMLYIGAMVFVALIGFAGMAIFG